MATGREILKIVSLAGLALLIGQGCSQKSVRVTSDSETFEQGAQYADNQTGAGNPFAQAYQPLGSWQRDSGVAQPQHENPSDAAFFEGSQGFEPEGPAQAYVDGLARNQQGNAQAGEYSGAQNSAQGGLSYFGSNQGGSEHWTKEYGAESWPNQNGSEPWANSGPLAALPEYEYGDGIGGNWNSGQGYNGGQGNAMAEEFIQEEFDAIAEAQPFSSPGFAQGGPDSQGERYYGQGPQPFAQGQGVPGSQFARVQVTLQDVFFEFDSWRISEEGRQALVHDAEWLEQNQSGSITVEGHCDQRGTRDYNLVLGKKRASAVRTYLVDLGVDAHKIQVISYGKERPFCFGSDEQCHQLNRRGHLQLHH